MKTNKFIKEYVRFDPNILAISLGFIEPLRNCDIGYKCIRIKPIKENMKELAKRANEYIEQHPEIKNSLKKPKNYMLSDYYLANFNKEELARYDSYYVTICEDLELLLLIFGKTMHHIYSPNRIIHFTERSFESYLYFLKEEIEEV